MARFVILQEYIPQYREQFFLDLERALASSGHDLVVAAGVPSGDFRGRGDAMGDSALDVIPVNSLKASILGRRIVIRFTAGVLRNADYIILEHARRNADVYKLLMPRPLRRRQIALWGHGRDHVKRPSILEAQTFKRLARRADWYFSYTQGGQKHLVDECGLDSNRVTVVQNSLDANKLRQQCISVGDNSKTAFRRKLNASGPILLSLGSLDQMKRIDFIISSAIELRRQLTDLALIFVGDGALRDEVVAATRRHDWIHWLGPQFGSGKATALSVADVIVNPGRVGLVAIDSFSARVPIVTVEAHYHAPEFEYLVNDHNSIITRNNVAAYVAEVFGLLTDSARRQVLINGCDNAFRTYTLEAMVNNFAAGLNRWHASARDGDG